MEFNIFITVFTCLVLCIACTSGASCSSHTTCESCAAAKSWISSCRWCPLSRACHAYGSLYNPCTWKQYITKTDKCYDLIPGEYNVDSAYTNTLLSASTYTDEPKECLDKIYPNNDIEIIEVIGRRCEDLSLFKYKECFAYTAVSHASKRIILAFRGTLLTQQLVDQVITSLVLPRQAFPSGGDVQAYFKRAFDALFPCVEQSIRQLIQQYPSYEVVVTGHSLGGAIASLSAVSLVYNNLVAKEKLSLYTFGMPRVGDKNYAINHDRLVSNSWRLIHHRDIVSHLPPCDIILGCYVSSYTSFHHGIEVFYPEYEMNVTSTYRICVKDEDNSCSNGIIAHEPCVFDLFNCIQNHVIYFGIHIGNICNSSNHTEYKTKYWGLFTENVCRRVDAKTLKIRN